MVHSVSTTKSIGKNISDIIEKEILFQKQKETQRSVHDKEKERDIYIFDIKQIIHVVSLHSILET